MIACAKRGGHNFIQSNRVDPYTRKCAKNYVPCAEGADPSEMICVDPNDPLSLENCPIVDIQIIYSSDKTVYVSNGYKVTENGWPSDRLDELNYIAFSKVISRTGIGY